MLLPGTAKACDSLGRYYVCVDRGYLALRNDKSNNSSNEIGQLYNGESVDIYDASDSTYWRVYSSKYDMFGYVNRNYLVHQADYVTTCIPDPCQTIILCGASHSYCDIRTVSVEKNYLALRNAKSYNKTNEIGQLYNGDTVHLIDTSDGTYWYVYSSKLDKSGYVNRNYLY